MPNLWNIKLYENGAEFWALKLTGESGIYIINYWPEGWMNDYKKYWVYRVFLSE